MVTQAEWKIRESGAHQYLKIALDDLDHAKLSLNHKHYRQAVEASQQSIEKTLKGYAIYGGVLKESDFFSPNHDIDLIGRGHDSFKIFKRMFEIQKEKIDQLKKEFRENPQFYTLTNNSQKQINEREHIFQKGIRVLEELESKARNKRMPSEEIQKYLAEITELHSRIQIVKDQRMEFWNKFMSSIILRIILHFFSGFMLWMNSTPKTEKEEMSKQIKSVLKNPKTEKMSREELISETLKLPIFQGFIKSIQTSVKGLWTNPPIRQKKNKTTQKAKKIFLLIGDAEQQMLDQIKITGTLLNLTILVKAHATSTRYAKFPAYDDPLEFYVETSPIVQNLDKIIQLTEKCIQDIDILISSRPKEISAGDS